MVDLSIVIPLLNEEESLSELHAWIQKVVSTMGISHEVIFIDDGSTDTSWQVIKKLKEQDTNVKGIKFTRNYGKSAALNEGFRLANGNVVITMDADMQDSPDEIPELYRMIVEDKYDLVSGWKKKRFDPITKTIPTKIYNAVTGWVSKVKLHDMNCGLKAYKKEVIKQIEVYGEMHRYIPVLAKWQGFNNIAEKVVQHRARKYGTTKFGWSRFVNGFLDLFSIMFIGKFGKRPMHFFGGLGTLITFIGFVILVYLAMSKTLFDEVGIAERPLFYLGILAVIIGMQLFIAGFLAELITRNSVERNDYSISEKIE